MAFLRFINLVVLSSDCFFCKYLQLQSGFISCTHTSLSPSPRINSRSRTLSVLQTGPHKTFNHNNEIMCSFDVSSLFTNDPLDETIQICLDKLYALPDPPTLPRSVLKVLLEFATKRSHFIFNGQYYDQIDGVAMGSPLGPVLANIFMCHFKEKWVLNNNARPSVWFRYVNDTFTLFDNKNTATQFLQYLNNCHANIKFTVEFEENNTTPFLEVLIKRYNHTFSKSIYRKKTFTGLYTKWDPFTPRKYKVNLIRTLILRCFRICSSPFLLRS